jgi:hypothetical protein
LSVAGSADCVADRDRLAGQILEAVAGTANAELSVDVDIVDGSDDDERASTTALVRLMLGPELVGVREIRAASCDEALAAVVAVTALALSTGAQEAPARSVAAPATVRAPAPRIDDAVQVEPVEPAVANDERWRLLAGAGMDVGTLPAATIAVAVGAGLRLGPGEARAFARYGLPSSQHEREVMTGSASSASLRADFAATALDYCLGIDAAQWLGACGGLELAVKRRVQVEQAAGQERSERERIGLSLGPVAGLALVLRAVPLQPQLELAAQWPVLGAEPAADVLGLRATVGAAVPF